MEETASASAEGSKEDKVKIVKRFFRSFRHGDVKGRPQQRPEHKNYGGKGGGGGIYCGGSCNQHSLVPQRRVGGRSENQGNLPTAVAG